MCNKKAIAKKMPIIIAFFAISIFAQQQEYSKKSSVYLHPVTLVPAFACLATEDYYFPFYFNFTGEFPLSGRYALIVNPYVGWLYGETDLGNFFGAGSGIGIRRFVNGNSDGLYLQLMPNVSYLKGEYLEGGEVYYGDYGDYRREYSPFWGINAEILGYIGYAIKYSKIHLFFDFGIGCGFSRYFSEVKYPVEGESKVNVRFWGIGEKNGLAIDINIGVGIPFL